MSLDTFKPHVQALAAQFDALANLEDGWLDGQGRAPNPEALARAARSLLDTFPESLPLPYVAPTAEGGLFLEWIGPAVRVSAELLLPAFQVELQAVLMAESRAVDETVDVDEPASWSPVYAFVARHFRN